MMARAVTLAQKGKHRQAAELLGKVVAVQPGLLSARYNLALVLLQSGAIDRALPHLDRILASEPRHSQALFSKGAGLLALGRAEEALPILLDLARSQDPECLLALGNAYRMLNRLGEAAAAFNNLVARAPGFVAGHINLALLLIGDSPAAALPVLDRAVALHPANAQLPAMLGQCLLRLGHFEQAVAPLERALGLDRDQLVARGHLMRAHRELADWDGEDRQFAILRGALAAPRTRTHYSISTQDAVFFPFTGAELRQIAANEARFRCPNVPAVASPAHGGAADTPLVIGYLSPDFRDHATMHLSGEVFGHHDRARVRVIAYSVGPDDGSPERAGVIAQSDAFVDLAGLSDAAAAARIRADGVHILVDMSVYTRYARPGIAARRPAAVQMAWLGLAASSGAGWFDYAIVDSVLVPERHRGHFSEKLVFMPHCYQANLSWQPPAAPPPRAELGLPEEGVVFCSFNSLRKLDRTTFALWMDILSQVTGSVLWLLAPSEVAQARLAQAALSLGIDPARLRWASPLPRAEHLRRLAAADLFVDSVVCGAHTTAADALRVAVPLVTVAGERLASRVAASVLHAVGMAELVAPDPTTMAALAVKLCTDPARLDAVKAALRAKLPSAPAFDPKGFARALEDAYAQAWQHHAAGRAPRDIQVSAASAP